MEQHIIKVEIPTRLDRYLRRLYPKLTQGILEKLLRSSKLKVNNHKTPAGYRVSNGDIIHFDKTLDLSSFTDDNNNEFSVNELVVNLSDKILNDYLLYEDDNMIIINKPSFLPVQNGTKINISIQDALLYLNNNKNFDLRIVHRLDKDTSGILIIAKNYLSSFYLTKSFKEKLITKTYQALVQGIPKKSSGIISNFIAKYDGEIREVKSDFQDAKEAITKYKVIWNKNNISLIEFAPITGRMHQLRLHAKILNCPIIGDKKYNTLDNKLFSKYMLLHAKTISIPSNIFGKEIIITSELPKYFLNFINKN